MQNNTRIILVRRPEAEPVPDDFRIVHEAVPSPASGQVLLNAVFVTDPYMRGRMRESKSYANPIAIGEVMGGAGVAEVVESKDSNFCSGDIVFAHTSWQSHSVSDGTHMRKIDPAAPVTYWLGILGMPGLTAYCAVNDIGKLESGETVVVSAASGAVGSVAGQIAKIKGCRVVGFVGTDEKCRYVVETLGFDACINRRTREIEPALKEACRDGVDFYLDNTGRPILDGVMHNLRLRARIAIVGGISAYNGRPADRPKSYSPARQSRSDRRVLVGDHFDHVEAFERDIKAWLGAGKMHYKEDVVEGPESAPLALIGLLPGDNFGKMIIKVA